MELLFIVFFLVFTAHYYYYKRTKKRMILTTEYAKIYKRYINAHVLYHTLMKKNAMKKVPLTREIIEGSLNKMKILDTSYTFREICCVKVSSYKGKGESKSRNKFIKKFCSEQKHIPANVKKLLDDVVMIQRDMLKYTNPMLYWVCENQYVIRNKFIITLFCCIVVFIKGIIYLLKLIKVEQIKLEKPELSSCNEIIKEYNFFEKILV
ncbi:hypothetical protein IX317_000368 [Fusobacterium sp. DD29]|uniref:hypothetical protein n=1 Tax=unclassified Fusobacterium TaxID=2648384 RepID=UPI001B8C5FAC|nr:MULTISPECIES: hypothetical protein [unclassified Fusobacterium]MBR8748709.1 hypothetical protein [Fusobacterium sp. DD29]MBR8760939.1 hypothetical protein [Fusobacterium sp. DD25]MBR8766988.1 hypothetical protein [Fusobacterium sp. DD43]MBR8770989.1 hypothetical protein [Fusobacterium sp. DD40]MBR8775264.1 hypothetical protein [Fusobacterium sp. DD17]